ncbi:DDE superfamily endonuclease [Fusarium oxysporum f. sp. albedinis]|nr:DDE superfamily endonuclease [Fusarium oxysporum f. sp. albedinis]
MNMNITLARDITIRKSGCPVPPTFHFNSKFTACPNIMAIDRRFPLIFLSSAMVLPWNIYIQQQKLLC